MAADQPVAVIALLEGEERLPEVLDRGEVLDPEELFFQGADEALGAAVALRLPHKRRTAGDAQEPQLGLEQMAHELAPMIVPQGQPDSDLLAVSAEVGLDALTERLQGLEAGAAT